MNRNERVFVARDQQDRRAVLCLVRSAAIWIVLLLGIAMTAIPVVVHGQPVNVQHVLCLAVLLPVAFVLQFLAIQAFRTTNDERIVWDPNNQSLTLSNFRVFDSPWTFGRIESMFRIAANQIESVKIVRGNGVHLRLKFDGRFVSISNDIQDFPELCRIVQDASER